MHHGRIVKRTGDGSVIEFRSVVDAVRCALEVQHVMVERNAGVAFDNQGRFRIYGRRLSGLDARDWLFGNPRRAPSRPTLHGDRDQIG